MFDHALEETAAGATLALHGNLVIQHAQELKTALLAALAKSNHLLVDLSRVENADVSALQLLCAAQREAAHLGGALALTGRPAAGFQRTVQDAGFIDRCFSGSDTSGLWTGVTD